MQKLPPGRNPAVAPRPRNVYIRAQHPAE